MPPTADSTLYSGYRAFVDTSDKAFIQNTVRVAVIRDLGAAGVEVWSAARRGFQPVPADETLPAEAWTLDVIKPVGAALYHALRDYYGEADLESVRALTKQLELAEQRLAVSETRRAALEDALIQQAETLAGQKATGSALSRDAASWLGLGPTYPPPPSSVGASRPRSNFGPGSVGEPERYEVWGGVQPPPENLSTPMGVGEDLSRPSGIGGAESDPPPGA